MNAMETNAPLSGLFALLGQGADNSLSALTDSEADSGLFSSLMNNLLPLDSTMNLSDVAAAGEGSELSLLQTLPQETQTLPLLTDALPGSEQTMPEVMTAANNTALLQGGVQDNGKQGGVEEAGEAQDNIDTLMQQIQQGQLKEIKSTSLAATEADNGSEVGLDDDGLSADDTSAAVVIPYLVMPQDVALQPVNNTNGESAVRQRQSMMNGMSPLVDGQPAPDDAGLPVISDDSEGEFYLPEPTQSVTKDLSLQPTAQPANADKNTLAAEFQLTSASVTDSQSLVEPSELTEADTDVGLNEHQENETEFANREKLVFGQDRKEWGGALGTRIMTMVAEGVQQARIHLDPPELGSMEIKLQISHDQAVVQVQAQNPQVREVLESNAYRLRDALAAQGIELNSFDISERGASEQSFSGSDHEGASDGYQGGGGDEGITDISADELSPMATVSTTNSILDTFA